MTEFKTLLLTSCSKTAVLPEILNTVVDDLILQVPVLRKMDLDGSVGSSDARIKCISRHVHTALIKLANLRFDNIFYVDLKRLG